MTELKIPYLKKLRTYDPEGITNELSAKGTKFSVDKINWKEHPHKPKVNVYAGYNYKYLFLHFSVQDDYIKAEGKSDQDPVWQDACVEFFVSVGENYRNFEFNCTGVCLSAIGPDRHSRIPLDKENLERILRYPTLNRNNLPVEGTKADWSLTVGIPMELIELAPEKKFKCNFYKCGDKTKIPHYLTWAPIKIPSPDFHRPEWFGEAELGKAAEKRQ
jgi:hypothetical protein